MSKEKSTQKVDDNAVQDTVAPAPTTIKQTDDNGKEKNVKVSDMPKTVNIPVSASNALTPEGGIQTIVPADAVEQVLQTDAANPQLTKEVNVLKDDYKTSDTVSKARYEQLANTLREVIDNHTFDAVHKDMYLTKAGLK